MEALLAAAAAAASPTGPTGKTSTPVYTNIADMNLDHRPGVGIGFMTARDDGACARTRNYKTTYLNEEILLNGVRKLAACNITLIRVGMMTVVKLPPALPPYVSLRGLMRNAEAAYTYSTWTTKESRKGHELSRVCVSDEDDELDSVPRNSYNPLTEPLTKSEDPWMTEEEEPMTRNQRLPSPTERQEMLMEMTTRRNNYETARRKLKGRTQLYEAAKANHHDWFAAYQASPQGQAIYERMAQHEKDARHMSIEWHTQPWEHATKEKIDLIADGDDYQKWRDSQKDQRKSEVSKSLL
ncbi:hypothetical protein H2200_011731 [Cladophialophora chaetospira]|uniref:Uncharacterized protein n=1 Tax=Cladophialophora chaetospira TaxID=386627 RepID=A0AA39CCS9_9EURO|nr:hypothetical protein H2200_011731 [Cladophialophora chaetospira]